MNTLSWQIGDDAAADGDQPARRVRAAVRRRRTRGRAAGADAHRPEPSRLRRRRSARASQAGLGARDRARLDQYLDHVREIERRIQRAEQQNGADPDVPDAPVGVPESFEEHVELLFDLLASRVSGRPHARLHVHARPRAQSADLSADRRDRAAPLDLAPRQQAGRSTAHAKVNTYHVDAVRPVPRAAAARRPTATARCSITRSILYGSGMGNGNVHSADHLPTLLVGSRAGGVEGQPAHRGAGA